MTLDIGSNYGPLNEALVEAAQARVDALRAADPGNTQPIPVDLVTASGSGLDPHISPAAAEYQVPRVARERGLGEDAVRALVAEHTESRTFGLLGEPRVQVLALNLALDESPNPRPQSLRSLPPPPMLGAGAPGADDQAPGEEEQRSGGRP